MTEVAFTVDGKPVSQGSMRAGISNGKAVVYHDRAPALSVWRHWISAAAVGAMNSGQGPGQPLSGPISVTLTFLLPRPMLHRGKGGDITPRWQKAMPDRAPDIDKLARAALDAMSGIVFWDDGQVCVLIAGKLYGDGQGGLAVNVSTVAL